MTLARRFVGYVFNFCVLVYRRISVSPFQLIVKMREENIKLLLNKLIKWRWLVLCLCVCMSCTTMKLISPSFVFIFSYGWLF